MALLNIRIPDDLRNRFKSICAAQGTNMRETILLLVEEFVRKEGKKKS
jgi:antitoxin component of RelBE/YafQ-DinJ toxin-antitoxin module